MSSSSSDHHHAVLHRASPEDAVAAAVRRLKAQGERVTPARIAVLTVLADSTDHLAADDIVDVVASSGVHRATVYRTLDLFADAGVVLRRHAPNGSATYHLDTTATGHEHLHGHCRSCGTVVSLPADAFEVVTVTLQHETGFVMDAAQTTFAGLCARCAESGHPTR